MKRLAIIFALLFSASIRVDAQVIPDVKLSDAGGKTVTAVSLADHKTPFVVSFWMTTCKPCMKELEALTDAVADWEGSFPLRIYAVSVDDSRSLQRAVAMSRNWEGITPLFDPNGDLRRALNISAVPQVFVYDKDGKQFYTHIGYRPGDEQELLSQLRKCAGK